MAELEDRRRQMALQKKKLDLLTQEHDKLQKEASFYKDRPPPFVLKQKIDTNLVQLDTTKSGIQSVEAELERIEALFDIELERLRRLWAGAPPGSLGPLPSLPKVVESGAASGASEAAASAATPAISAPPGKTERSPR